MKFEDLTDKELMILKHQAIELQDGRLLKRINQEISRRNKEL